MYLVFVESLVPIIYSLFSSFFVEGTQPSVRFVVELGVNFLSVDPIENLGSSLPISDFPRYVIIETHKGVLDVLPLQIKAWCIWHEKIYTDFAHRDVLIFG